VGHFECKFQTEGAITLEN